MAKRLTVAVTVMQDGKGRIEMVRMTLNARGVRGWSKAKQRRFSGLLAEYARNEKGR